MMTVAIDARVSALPGLRRCRLDDRGARNFAAVVGFVAYGLLLALAWVRLHAVDVALTEAAIGGGLCGVLLIGAAARLRAAEAEGDSGASERALASCRAACPRLSRRRSRRRSLAARSRRRRCAPAAAEISGRPVSATRSPTC